MSVVAAILGESPQVLDVTRSTAGTLTLGVRSPGATSVVQVTASVQPLGPREIQLLPEGVRTRFPVKLFATSELRAAGDVTGAAGDKFTFAGRTFEVIAVEDWSTHGGYWKAIAARVG